jgi:hypothetical protein
MFLTATLSLNPSAATEYVASDDEDEKPELLEHETFSTSSILQQLVLTMRDVGIKDAMVLSHDGVELFRDDNGDSDDLTSALKAFARNTPDAAKQHFSTLRLVLEHQGDLLKIVVDVRVERAHEIDHPPIQIGLAGFLRIFRSEGDIAVERQGAFDAIFRDQSGYEEVCDAARDEFDEFIRKLDGACQQRIEIDDVETDSCLRIISSEDSTDDAATHWAQLFDHSCIEKNDVMYCYRWHQKCCDGDVELSHCELIDASGAVRKRYHKKKNRVEIDRDLKNGDATCDSHGTPEGGWRVHDDSLIGSRPSHENPLRGLIIPEDRIPPGLIPFLGPSKRQVWRAVANEIHASFVDGAFILQDAIVYRWETVPIRLAVSTNYNGENTQYTTRMIAQTSCREKFSIYRTGIMSFVGRALGLQDIETGNQYFDQSFVIKGDDPEFIRKFFADPYLRDLIAGQPDFDLSVSGSMRFTCNGVLKDPDRIVRLFELFIELLQRLEEQR